jgi:hypothetical protein
MGVVYFLPLTTFGFGSALWIDASKRPKTKWQKHWTTRVQQQQPYSQCAYHIVAPEIGRSFTSGIIFDIIMELGDFNFL